MASNREEAFEQPLKRSAVMQKQRDEMVSENGNGRPGFEQSVNETARAEGTTIDAENDTTRITDLEQISTLQQAPIAGFTQPPSSPTSLLKSANPPIKQGVRKDTDSTTASTEDMDTQKETTSTVEDEAKARIFEAQYWQSKMNAPGTSQATWQQDAKQFVGDHQQHLAFTVETHTTELDAVKKDLSGAREYIAELHWKLGSLEARLEEATTKIEANATKFDKAITKVDEAITKMTEKWEMRIGGLAEPRAGTDVFLGVQQKTSSPTMSAVPKMVAKNLSEAAAAVISSMQRTRSKHGLPRHDSLEHIIKRPRVLFEPISTLPQITAQTQAAPSLVSQAQSTSNSVPASTQTTSQTKITSPAISQAQSTSHSVPASPHLYSHNTFPPGMSGNFPVQYGMEAPEKKRKNGRPITKYII